MSSFDKIVEKVLCFDYLPSEDEWALCDENGWTVAHVYAGRRILPGSFTQYALSDNKGCTVAHHAAAHRHLPVSFSDWHLTDGDGHDVAFVAGQTERRVIQKINARKSSPVTPERRKAESNLLGTFLTLLKESEPHHKRRI